MKEIRTHAFPWIGRLMTAHALLSANFWMIQLFGCMTKHTTDNSEVYILRFIIAKYNTMLQQK